jgi:hypothetical protein
VGRPGVVCDEGLKIKSCKGLAGTRGGQARVLVCSTFSRHLADEFHLDACRKQRLQAVD